MILRTAVVLIALLVSSAAQAGYMTYQKWSAMPEVYRVAYITSARMTDTQLAANVLNFAKDKPDSRRGQPDQRQRPNLNL
ncbi:MAG: hypothetical protein E6G70_08525 [Alphaproteobacteria bacterium]|nr:MAG: hypothetical protein E6G70_08525 [Alphaproteobacteria bacterium]